MAVRRTREEKIKIQQRREQEKYEWKEEAAPPLTQSESSRKETRKEESQEQRWLRKDLRQTLIAMVLVLLLLAYFVWRSLQ